MRSYFIDWKELFLSGVVRQILDRNALGAVKDRLLNLADFIFVFPSGLAVRSFEEKLARGAEAMVRAGSLRPDWYPPKVVIPVGEFPERLYMPRKAFAEKPALLLAWREALGSNETAAKDVFRNLPPAGDFAGRLDIAAYLARLHEEVAKEGLSFSSPQKYVKERIPEEVVRWNALCAIQNQYYKTLGRWGLCDRQTERLAAVEENRVKTDKTVVLVGTADLSNLQKKILEKIEERVVLFIQAPGEAKDLFDGFGCLKAEAWENYQIEIPREESIVAASDTVKEGEYAACYTHLRGAERGVFRRGRVALGLLDPSSRPYLAEKLADLGIEAHFGEGQPFASCRVAALLRGAADYLRTESYDSFAAWIRHPDVDAAFRRISNAEESQEPCDWLTELDRYQNKYVPQTVALAALSKGDFRDGKKSLSRLSRAARSVLAALWGTDDGDVSSEDLRRTAPLSQYLDRIGKFLAMFYPDREPSEDEADGASLPVDDQIDQGLKILYQAFDQINALPGGADPELTAGEAIGFILRCASGQIREETSDDAVDITGGLDARFSEAPNLILVGMNEGIVPQSQSSDVFLPDTVRTEVNIENNRRRYARDAYYLTAIVRRLDAEGNDGLRILFARAGSDGSPTPPSRLLFAENEGKIAERVERFFGGDASDDSPEKGELAPYFAVEPPKDGDLRASAPDGAPDPFALPVIPLSGELPKEMRVTDFASFLESPYRYFLRKIYELATFDDSNPEIPVSTFGSIAHDVLREFGKNDVRDSADEKEIREFLIAELGKTVEKYKMRGAAGTALLQLELIRRRLEGFARWQAGWRRLGNSIIAVEKETWYKLAGKKPYDGAAAFPLTLTGMIDRLDYNEEHDQWFVFDYKTFDKDGGKEDKDNEDLRIRLEWLLSDPEGRRETDAVELPAVNIKGNNMAEQEHRGKDQKIFPEDLKFPEKRWKNLQLPLYTRMAERLIGEIGLTRGKNPLIPGYILLKKDNSCEASFAAWTEDDIDDAVRTARWVRRTIAEIWQKGEADPNAPVDPNREDLGKLCEPNKKTWNSKGTPSWDILRDFPD